LLFIQCDTCKDAFNGCCSDVCKDVIALPIEQQKELRKNKHYNYSDMLYHKGRIRPSISQLQKYTLNQRP
jgi:UPF0176 protein